MTRNGYFGPGAEAGTSQPPDTTEEVTLAGQQAATVAGAGPERDPNGNEGACPSRRVRTLGSYGSCCSEAVWRRRGLALTVRHGLVSLTHVPSGLSLPRFNGLDATEALACLRAGLILTDALDWSQVTEGMCLDPSPERLELQHLVAVVSEMVEVRR